MINDANRPAGALLFPRGNLLSVLPMRKNLVIVPAAIALLIMAGCEERHSMRALPDRQEHAYVDPTGKAGLGNVLTPEEGEIFITVGPKDTLSSVAKKYNTTVRGLIERNDLKDGLPAPGKNLIVPSPTK